MSGYLHSKQSIASNHSQIQQLCEDIVTEITTIDALETNAFQFVIQTIPGLTTWMQGYTAYNLLLEPAARGDDPWTHQLVYSVALPRIKTVIQSISDQQKQITETASDLPLVAGSIFSFDGTRFHESQLTFAVTYPNGTVDDAPYYTIWPDGVNWSNGTSGAGQINGPFIPQPGQLCFLSYPLGSNPRFWSPLTRPNFFPWLSPPAAAKVYTESLQAFAAYPNLVTDQLKRQTAFSQLTDGWQTFDQSVKSNLIKVDADKIAWTDLPRLVV